MYPPAVVSALSLCSLKREEPSSPPARRSSESGKPSDSHSFTLPEHLSSLLSELEVPACRGDEAERLHQICGDPGSYPRHGHRPRGPSFLSSREKQKTPVNQGSRPQSSDGSSAAAIPEVFSWSDPTTSGIAAFFSHGGGDSPGGEGAGGDRQSLHENKIMTSFRERAEQAVDAYDESQKERSGLAFSEEDTPATRKELFFDSVLQRDLNQASVHPVSTVAASSPPEAREEEDHVEGSSSLSSTLFRRSSSPAASPSSSASPSSLWWEGSLQLRRRCFNYERLFLTTPEIRDLLLRPESWNLSGRERASYAGRGEATSSERPKGRPDGASTEATVLSSSGEEDGNTEEPNGRSQTNARSLADVLLDNILVVDISSSSGLSGGAFVNWKEGRHVFYTGLYNLAVRVQPFSEVLKKLRNREDAKRPHRRKRALLLSAHSDSAGRSPGASDDAAMVGTVFEVARNVVYRHLDSSEKLVPGYSQERRREEGGSATNHDDKNLEGSSWLLRAPLIVDINGKKNKKKVHEGIRRLLYGCL